MLMMMMILIEIVIIKVSGHIFKCNVALNDDMITTTNPKKMMKVVIC